MISSRLNLFAVADSSWWGKLVSLFTRSEYNHLVLYYPDINMIYEFGPSGLNIRRRNPGELDNACFITWREVQDSHLRAWLTHYQRCPGYDYIGTTVNWLAGKIGSKFRVEAPNCVMFVVDMLQLDQKCIGWDPGKFVRKWGYDPSL